MFSFRNCVASTDKIEAQKYTEERELLGQHFAGPSEEVDSVGDHVVLEKNPQQLSHLRGLPHA